MEVAEARELLCLLGEPKAFALLGLIAPHVDDETALLAIARGTIERGCHPEMVARVMTAALTLLAERPARMH